MLLFMTREHSGAESLTRPVRCLPFAYCGFTVRMCQVTPASISKCAGIIIYNIKRLYNCTSGPVTSWQGRLLRPLSVYDKHMTK